MALVVTFSTVFPPSDPQHTHAPVMVGRSARTERIDVGAASAGGNIGALAASGGESIVRLYAAEDCWVVVGSSPTVQAGEGWFMNTDTYLELWVEPGDKVAVIEA